MRLESHRRSGTRRKVLAELLPSPPSPPSPASNDSSRPCERALACFNGGGEGRRARSAAPSSRSDCARYNLTLPAALGTASLRVTFVGTSALNQTLGTLEGITAHLHDTGDRPTALYVGVGASRARTLPLRASRLAPSARVRQRDRSPGAAQRAAPAAPGIRRPQPLDAAPRPHLGVGRAGSRLVGGSVWPTRSRSSAAARGVSFATVRAGDRHRSTGAVALGGLLVVAVGARNSRVLRALSEQ